MSSTANASPPSRDSGPTKASSSPSYVLITLLGFLWLWSIVICAGFWSTDDNYSYGFVVPPLVLLYLWRRLGNRPDSFWASFSEQGAGRLRIHPLLLAIPAFAMFPVEVYRSEYHQSGMVLWAINGAAVGLTLASFLWTGGYPLLRIAAFPVLFYLTSVPWPDRLAHPLQQNLMIGVAEVVTEVLLWLGIPVETGTGAVLKLSKGSVGIVEACSGIRSLQSGLMLSLAIGELLLLPVARRAGLFALTMGLALLSNFIRTFTLCWIMEKSGPEAMEKAHDWVGNIAMYSFYIAIWLLGKWLAAGNTAGDEWPRSRAKDAPARLRFLRWDRVPDFRPVLVVLLACFATVHVWYAVLAQRAKPQTAPYFTAQDGKRPGVRKNHFDEGAWNQLLATSGESLRYTNSLAPFGFVDAYHLFWKPSPQSKRALGHRPDSCMPGSGWKQVGNVGVTNVVVDGVPLQFYIFRFERPDVKAVQLWGVWRNGRPVVMSYGDSYNPHPEVYQPWPTDRHLLGVELVSCFVAYPLNAPEPPVNIAARSIGEMFRYKSVEP
jgi:exosortase